MRYMTVGMLLFVGSLLGACASERPATPPEAPMAVSPGETTTQSDPEMIEPAGDVELGVEEAPMTVADPSERIYEVELARRLQEAKRNAAIEAAVKELSGREPAGR